MTREEAYRILSNGLVNAPSEYEWCMAFEVAIQLLSQEPCTDAVSRKWLKKKLQEHHDFFVNAYGGFKNMPQTEKARVDEIIHCIAEVVNAPSVYPQHREDAVSRASVIKAEQEWRVRKTMDKWISVSKRLPRAEYGESDSVLVCFENKIQCVLYFDGSNWRYPTGEIYISVNHKNGWHNKVIAWMPLPKPFEPQESEDKE